MVEKKAKTKKRPSRRQRQAVRKPLDLDYPRPCVTVDLVILTILDADLKLLLIRRETPPHRGALALPGGFVRVGAASKDQGD